jgi:hypothetical protein
LSGLQPQEELEVKGMTNQSIRGENTADKESFMLNSNLWFCTLFLVVLLNVLSVVWCCDVSE